jgi:transcriptional regulator with XRE-family HTH domain
MALLFRERLAAIIRRSGLNHAQFARAAGVDRSTLSQLLTAADERLPRGDTVAAIAVSARVSADWLLGLTQREEIGAQLIESVLQIETEASSPADDRFWRWLAEAEGSRVRTVPVSFPDFLKTQAVLRHEYGVSHSTDPERGISAAAARLDLFRRAEANIEACVTVQAMKSFARGEGVWEGLDAEARHAGLASLSALLDELYPRVRIFLFDVAATYSVPFTVFGARRAVIFLGPNYLVFNGSDQIRMLARRFDELIRAAVVQPDEMRGYLKRLEPPGPG